MNDARDISGPGAEAPRATALRVLLQTEALRLLLAGMYFVLGIWRPERSFGKARLLRGAADITGPVPYINNRRALRTMIHDWAGREAGPAARRTPKLWLASKAINNNPDPNIRRMGHDAWATGRAYPSVPGLGPTSTGRSGDIPDIYESHFGRTFAGNTGAAGGCKIILAPP